MKKLFLLCLLAVLVVACSPATDDTQQATDPTDSAPIAAESPTEPPAALPTAVEETATDEPVAEESTDETVVEETTDSEGAKTFLPALTPAEAGEIRDTDFVKGNPDASVTIVEYGDFQ